MLAWWWSVFPGLEYKACFSSSVRRFTRIIRWPLKNNLLEDTIVPKLSPKEKNVSVLIVTIMMKFLPRSEIKAYSSSFLLLFTKIILGPLNHNLFKVAYVCHCFLYCMCLECYHSDKVSFQDQNWKLPLLSFFSCWQEPCPPGSDLLKLSFFPTTSSATATPQQRQRIPPAAGLFSVDQVRLYAVLGGVLIFSVFKKGWRDHPLGWSYTN